MTKIVIILMIHMKITAASDIRKQLWKIAIKHSTPAVALKASPELAELLRQQHRDVRPSQHLNKAHWSTVYLDGSLPDSQIYYLVDASYQQAVKMLPEPVRQQLTR